MEHFLYLINSQQEVKHIVKFQSCIYKHRTFKVIIITLIQTLHYINTTKTNINKITNSLQ
jgi:hypothetical protein